MIKVNSVILNILKFHSACLNIPYSIHAFILIFRPPCENLFCLVLILTIL